MFQIERVISDQNYLVVELATGKKKVIHHDLMRLIPHSLAQNIAKKYQYPIKDMKCKEKLEDEDSIPSEDDTQGPLEELKDTDLYLRSMKNQRVHDEQDNADSPQLVREEDNEIIQLRRSQRQRRTPQWMEAYHHQ